MTPGSRMPRLIGYAMAVIAAFGLALAFAFVCAPYPVDWAEGRVFDTARLIVAGSPIYCDIQVLPCADLTYPPPYATLVALVARPFGLTFAAGRAVSFVGLLSVLVSLYRIARIGCGKRASLAAPAVFLFFVEACFFAGLMRPDFLALALLVCGIDVLLRRQTIPGAVASALLVLLAFFVKPQWLATGFAMCLYLVVVDRRRLFAFVATGAAGGAIILALGQAWSGGRFIDHHFWYVISPGRTLAQLGMVLFYGLLPWVGFVALALYQSVRALREKRFAFVPIYFLASLAWSLIAGGSTGAAPNYLLELYVATAVTLAGLFQEIPRHPRFARVALSLQVLFCLFANPWIGLERYLSLRKLWSSRAVLAADLRAAPEPIFVEELGLAGYTGHRLFVNPYVVTQLTRMRRWNETPFLALLRAGAFSRIVLREAPADNPSRLQRERFTDEMLDAIVSRYRLAWSDGSWFVYQPKP